jgi:outer membrane receptor for ferrienterochelin and colicin
MVVPGCEESQRSDRCQHRRKVRAHLHTIISWMPASQGSSPGATRPPVDLLRHPNYSTDFKSKGNASLTWLKGEWSATVLANRFGRSPNYAAYSSDGYTAKGAAKLPGWIRWNGSVTYNPIKSLGLSLQVTNLFNKMPPVDHTYPGTTSLPYNQDNYNVYGRAMYLEANYKFGQGS